METGEVPTPAGARHGSLPPPGGSEQPNGAGTGIPVKLIQDLKTTKQGPKHPGKGQASLASASPHPGLNCLICVSGSR